MPTFELFVILRDHKIRSRRATDTSESKLNAFNPQHKACANQWRETYQASLFSEIIGARFQYGVVFNNVATYNKVLFTDFQSP